MDTEILQQLADQLGVGLDALWAALLRQALISGAFDAGIAVLVGVLLWGNYRVWKHECDEVGQMAANVTASVVALVLLAILYAAVYHSVTAFLNPEWWAINLILEKVT